ncbi:MAG: BamA/TamA family outer membrane protein [Bacteroidetes bacterium]|nr:BamA/TamA family outer membrane protein [Bacteroidota bacterium]
MRFFLYIFWSLLFCFECFSKTTTTDVLSETLDITSTSQITYSSLSLPKEGEISDIRFVGNAYFSSSVLADAISLRPSNLSYTHQVFRFYYRQFSLNPYTPNPLRDALNTSLRGFQDEYRFFDQTSAENDVTSLLNLYNQNGFHNASASFTFIFDSTERLNILTFHIIENQPYKIDTIVYNGLELLPVNLQEQISPLLLASNKKQFNELTIKQNSDRILYFLQDNGYYFAKYEQPIVASEISSFKDSIYISFSTGKRCKIGEIKLTHNYRDQPAVSSNLVREMLDFHTEDWFSRSSLSKSQLNLYNLNTFDLVVIDTNGLSENEEYITLSIQVSLQYKKLQEISLAPFVNRTTYDNFTNFGLELSYLHRNFGGSAQSFTIFSRVVWQDFSFKFTNPTFPYIVFTSISRELLTGIQFSQPYFFSIWSWKVGATAQTSYSNRKIQSGLPFQSTSLGVSSLPLRVSLPVTLPTYTLFNSLVFEIATEWQNIDNYEEVNTEMITNSYDSNPDIFTKNIQAKDEFLLPFNQINLYSHKGADTINGSFRNLGFIFSFTGIGDTRDNPFSPLNGNFLSLSFEGAVGGLYRFSRFQFTDYKFWNFLSNDVLAFKFRVGYIIIDLSTDAFIPFDKRFFAGGANSVRSYSSRSLFDINSSNLEGALSYTNNLTGNSAILEGSVEYRYRFSRPHGFSTMLADQIEQLGITAFMDWGNVFNRFTDKKYNSATLNDILTGLAIGVGAGIRRETPVGPIRVDFAVKFYDPTVTSNKWIFNRQAFSDIQIHIGLGHAF